MAAPTLVVRYSTDDASDATPAWTDVTSYVRSFSTSRGRESELARVDAGTFEIVLNNRTRQWDPTLTAALRPMNRWNIRATLPNGTTEDIILGYAESYEQQWPGVGMDAITVVRGVDEFKVLAQDRLPTTDPPRDSYQDMVMYDRPSAYWPMNVTIADYNAGQPDLVGSAALYASGTATFLFGGAIVGDEAALYKGALCFAGDDLTTKPIANAGESGDCGGLAEFTCEFWFRRVGILPGAEENLVRSPTAGGITPWRVNWSTTGKFKAIARNSGGTTYTVTGTTTPTDTAVGDAGPWYHVVATITGGSLRLYVNGVSEGTPVAFTGSFGTMDAGSNLGVGDTGGDDGRGFDEVAVYRYGLSSTRIAAHYTAGSARGFARAQDPGPRITSVLASSSSVAATSIRTGTHAMIGSYMTGQDPLGEMRKAESAEATDAVLFISPTGTITFLDAAHRSASPWNTVQATFDDDGTDLPYQDISLDYSDSFIANEWNVTKAGGTLTTTSDATSISRYGKRSQSLTDLPITDDADVTSIATDMLAKYKDPMTRITGLGLLATGTATFINTIFTLDIGDRIRVFRTPMGGGARIDQTLFVQKVAIDGDPSGPWRIRLGVSPL